MTDPLRVAFVGQGVFFRQCSLEHAVDGIEPSFVDFRAAAAPGPLLGALQELDPDVVLVFRPEIVPPGLFDSLRALTIGYLTEPLPRDEYSRHPDLHARMSWLKQVDPGNFDRIVSFDPLIAETASNVLPVWRSLPIPVADSLFMDVCRRSDPPRLLFVGRSTPHREQLLEPIKRAHPIVHIGHGLFGERLARFFREADVQLNLHNNPYPSFENRVCIALAAGHLVISEPLSPLHGLEPGRDHLEARDAEQLRALVDRLFAEPNAFLELQQAGRDQAERFRASRVYPSLVRDALADLAEHGSRRRSRLAAAHPDPA
ncbi:MAG: glycosyltransferase family protein [Solirubrobacteraceae bacterium]